MESASPGGRAQTEGPDGQRLASHPGRNSNSMGSLQLRDPEHAPASTSKLSFVVGEKRAMPFMFRGPGSDASGNEDFQSSPISRATVLGECREAIFPAQEPARPVPVTFRPGRGRISPSHFCVAPKPKGHTTATTRMEVSITSGARIPSHCRLGAGREGPRFCQAVRYCANPRSAAKPHPQGTSGNSGIGSIFIF